MNMEINISKTKTYVISVKDAVLRKQHLEKVMSDLNFTDWSYFDAINVKNRFPYWVGLGLSNMLLLEAAVYPCIVLEDDVAPTEWFTDKIEIETDGLTYLGLSSWGMKTGSSTYLGVEFKTYNKNLCIVKYMLGQHAIFYPNKEIAKQFYSNTIHHLFENETSTANDELWAKKQAEYKTYALMCPSFYQKCNRNEPYTNFKIN